MKKLIISLHWPHDKFALGWSIYYPNEEFPDHEIELSLLIITLSIHF